MAGERPTIMVGDPSIDSLGPEAARLSAGYGLVLDAWQELVSDEWLGTGLDGKWTHPVCGLSVPRQNGKNATLEVRELVGLVGLGEKILHTAHEVKTAQQHFRRLKYFFGTKANDPGARFPELNAMVLAVRNVNGQEAVFLKNGATVEIVARSKSSGRGFTVDLLVLDEAQEMTEDALEAILSATSSPPLGNPQRIFTGTPPGPNASGEVFSRVRREALADDHAHMSWLEWSPPGQPKDVAEIDVDSEDLWRELNPGVDAGRITLQTIRSERRMFSLEGFARERLGWWASDDNSRRLISPEAWESTGVEVLPAVLRPPSPTIRALGVVFSKDGTRVAVGGALHSRRSGRTHVEVVAEKSGFVDAGVAGLADWINERRDSLALVTVCGRSGALALEAALRERKFPPKGLHVMSTTEYFAACSRFFDAVQDKSVSHPAGYTDGDILDRSVSVSDRKIRAADGAWGWESTLEPGDEVPLEAVSVALWSARTTKRRPGRKQGILS